MAATAECVQACVDSRIQSGISLEMDDQQFNQWVDLLERRIGLFIAPERRSFLESGIRSRLYVTGIRDYDDYYRRLSSRRANAEEWSLLIDCLTVHETSFFRHDASMRLVEEVLLPELLAEETSYHVWSVGCATGEEVYSLAMLTDAALSGYQGKRSFGVMGTDISLPSLHHARTGVYLNRRMAGIREVFRNRYCQAMSGNYFQIKADLRRRVCFSQLNLRDLANAPFAAQNLIYCQNLLIYYDRERRLQIVNQLANFLCPGGVLILGPGELLNWKRPDMEQVRYADTLAYRRTA